MNSGNLDLFDVTFSADSLLVFPSTIGRIGVPEGGISSTPIVSFTMEHVLPASGVGSLLPMHLGVLNDNVNLSYKYEIVPFEHSVLNDSLIVSLMDSTIATSDTTADTIWVAGDTLNINSVEKDTLSNSLDYSVSGTLRGAIIEVLFSGQKMQDYDINIEYNAQIFQWSGWSFTHFYTYSSADVDTSVVINSGNASLRVRIVGSEHSNVLIDTLAAPGDSIDTSGILRFTNADSTGQVILLGNKTNQPYIFKMMGELITSGYAGIYFGE